MPGGIERRTPRAWLVLATRVLSLAFFATAIAGRHHLAWLLIALGLGIGMLPIVWRRKAAVAAHSVYTASADQLLPDGKQLPGQLSITTSALIWTPSRFSMSDGFPVSLGAEDCLEIALQRGTAVLDLIITFTRVDGEKLRFLTHSNRRVRSAVAQLTVERPPAPQTTEPS